MGEWFAFGEKKSFQSSLSALSFLYHDSRTNVGFEDVEV